MRWEVYHCPGEYLVGNTRLFFGVKFYILPQFMKLIPKYIKHASMEFTICYTG
jgi:hypothetical protein